VIARLVRNGAGDPAFKNYSRTILARLRAGARGPDQTRFHRRLPLPALRNF
jgi:hypothetical protein